jgi:hypothetical protein
MANAAVLAVTNRARTTTAQTHLAALTTMLQRARVVRQRAVEAVRAVRAHGAYSPQQLRASPTPCSRGWTAATRRGAPLSHRQRDPFVVAPARRVRDELFYSARLARAHMPWLRTIFIVTQRPHRPWWLGVDGANAAAPGPRLVVVHHDSFFGPEVAQPTFNSNVIESQLAALPQLAEHFVLFNDDFFVGQPLPRSAFFADDGTPVLRMSGRQSSCRRSLNASWTQHLVNLHSVCDVVGVACGTPAHVCLPLRKSVLHAATTLLAPLVRALRQTRSASDFPLVYVAASATPWRELSHHIHTRKYSSGDEFAHDVEARGGALPHLFCINDGFDTPRAHAALRHALEAAT